MLWSIAGLLINHIEMNAFVIAGGRSLFAALTVICFMLLTKQRFVLSRDTVISGVKIGFIFSIFSPYFFIFFIQLNFTKKIHNLANKLTDFCIDFLGSIPACKVAYF